MGWLGQWVGQSADLVGETVALVGWMVVAWVHCWSGWKKVGEMFGSIGWSES